MIAVESFDLSYLSDQSQNQIQKFYFWRIRFKSHSEQLSSWSCHFSEEPCLGEVAESEVLCACMND